MKKILVATTVAMTLALGTVSVWADGETRKVCVDVKDKEGKPVKDKDGKTKQSCKEVKAHKKLEGTEIPKK